jgi:hypothetical protein
MAGGRPTKYTPELLAKARDYLPRWREFGNAIPTHIAFGMYLGISTETVYAWAADENKSEFSEIVKAINAAQQQELLDRGLEGTFNPTIAKLVLGRHGFSDKVDQTIGGQPGNPIRSEVTFVGVSKNTD